jgi:Ca2+-binding EF-hand superfamily protein
MRKILILVLALVPFGLGAQDLSPALQKRITGDPETYLEQAAAVIMGYGREGAISAAELQNYIALERAGARASALRSLLAMDLDADGTLTEEEVAFAAAAASGRTRGRLWAMFLEADAGGDGRVTGPEMAVLAAAAGMKGFSEGKAEGVLALLAFDRNGDGRVSLAEVTAGVAGLAPPEAAAG